MKTYYRKRKNYLLDRGAGALPKFLFVGIALTGSLLIWIIKALGDPQNPAMQFLVVAIPVGFILIYCALASRTTTFYLREDQIGDNAYYLGFLFTLSSLAYALWNFSHGAKDATDIISSFGVALWSTIVGIALRVFFAQLRQDPTDVEKDARAKIAETASVLTAELNQASVAFNTYRRNLQQSVDEAFVANTKTVSTALEENTKAFTTATTAMAAQIHASFEEFTTQAKKLNEVATKTVKALEALHQRIEKIEAPENLITEKIKGAFAEFEKLGKEISKLVAAQAGSLEKAVANSASLQQSLQALNAQVSSLHTNSEAVGNNIRNLTPIVGLLEGLSQGLTRLSGEVSRFVQVQSGANTTISHHADEMATHLERSRQYTDETHQALASMVRTLAENQ